MLVLRLQRTGRKNLASYRIVAAEKTRPVKGKFLEILGHYLPAEKKPVLSIDTNRAQELISKGAIPSDTVARILNKEGVKGMEKYMDRYTKKRSKSAPAEEPAAPAASTPAAAPVADAPVEVAPATEAAPAATEASASEATADKPADDNAEKKE